MERLDASDREAGIVHTPLSEAQKQKIAEVRSVCAARVAEREILHRDEVRKAPDAASREKLEQELADDRRRHESDRDREIEKIRKAAG